MNTSPVPSRYQVESVLKEVGRELRGYEEDFKWFLPWVYSEDRHESVRSRSGHYSPVETIAVEKEAARISLTQSFKRLEQALEDVKSARGLLKDAEPNFRPAEDQAWKITHPEEMDRGEKQRLRETQRRRKASGKGWGEG